MEWMTTAMDKLMRGAFAVVALAAPLAAIAKPTRLPARGDFRRGSGAGQPGWGGGTDIDLYYLEASNHPL